MKRKFGEIEAVQDMDDKTQEDSSRKRQEQENQISSSLFKNEMDQERFQKIFELLQESELLKEMDISSDINKEIAEYSNGHWVEHEECSSMISVLFNDHQNLC